MKTVFLKSETKFGCYAESNNKQNKFLHKEEFTIADVLAADVPLKDKAWFIRKNCQFTTDEYRQFAIGCALCVLPIYEAKYPGNNAPREAIEAAKDYLAGTITIDALCEKRHAAADAAADAAAYADAYADAYAADAYAAAAAAAYAAADAYAADAYAADADGNKKIDYRELLLQFFKEFTTVKETV